MMAHPCLHWSWITKKYSVGNPSPYGYQKGENIVFQQPTSMKTGGAVKLSLSHNLSLENKQCCLNEEIPTQMNAATEEEIYISQGFVIQKITQMSVQYAMQQILKDAASQGRQQFAQELKR